MGVIGIDLSISHTGMAWAANVEAIKTSPAASMEVRISDIVEEIKVAVYEADGPILVVMEDFVVRSPASAVLGMLHGVVRHYLFASKIPFAVLTPATLKKFATGRGNADKADMRMALFKRTGVDDDDDNRVDAAWLRYAGLWRVGHPAFDLPVDQIAALDKVVWP